MPEIIIIDNAEPADSSYNTPLKEAISQLSGQAPVVMAYNDAPDQTERINRARAVILSGVPLTYPAETAKDRQLYISSWLPGLSVPVLGICLGHQIIGVFFGAEVTSGTEVESGSCTIETLQDDKIFNGLKKSFEVESAHWASIPVPSGFKQLARSIPGPYSERGCQNQIMVHVKTRIYGCQFHPESSDQGMVILDNFLRLGA